MKSKSSYFLTTLLIISLTGVSKLTAQTYISGGIYNNTTWTFVNSPYIVTDDLTLFPDDTLTIEPGVIIKFNDAIGFEVRGRIVSVGSPTDSILFTSTSANPVQGIWDGVYLNNGLGGNGQIQYSIFEYANHAISTACCGVGGPLNILNSSFNSNSVAMYWYSGWHVIIDSCYFHNNNLTIYGADKTITNSTFVNNTYGLFQAARMDVSNCTFCGNHTAMDLEGGASNLQNNIVMNNVVGVKGGFDTFLNNVIALNDTGIIITGSTIGSNNIICSNYYYNLINNSVFNLSVVNNCWCDTNSTSISQKIYDGYDNASLGLIDFTPYIICDTLAIPPFICQGAPTGIDLQTNETIKVSVYPNPMQDYSVVRVNKALVNAQITITNLMGQNVLRLTNQNGNEFTLNRQNLYDGIYFVNVSDQGKTICNLKLIIL